MQYLASRSYTAERQPALPVSLQEEKSDDQRKNRYQRPGQNQGVEQLGTTVRTRLGVPRCQTQREWVIVGIARAVLGTIIEPRMMANTSVRPGNRNLAKT